MGNDMNVIETDSSVINNANQQITVGFNKRKPIWCERYVHNLFYLN